MTTHHDMGSYFVGSHLIITTTSMIAMVVVNVVKEEVVLNSRLRTCRMTINFILSIS